MADRAIPHDVGVLSVARTLPAGVRVAIPAVLLAIYVAQCFWFIGTQSLTYDEPIHIAEGLDAWRHGRFEQYNDHPPLARLLCTLPLVGSKWQVDVEQLPDGFRVHHVDPDPISLACRARAVNAFLGLLLGLLLWMEARNCFSARGANFALALFACSPSLIAHFSLATTDGAATLLIFATAVQIRRWYNQPSWKNTFQIGVILGLLLLAKFSSLAVFVLAIVWLLVLVQGHVSFRPWRWNWRRVSVALAIALAVLWAGYFFHVSHLTIRDGVLTVTHPNWTAPLVKPVRQRFNVSISVPAGEYIAGFRDLVFHNNRGQRAFFLGQISPRGGWKLYYPVTILLKWSLIPLLFAGLGLWICCRREVPLPAGFWIIFTFPVFYFVLAIFAHFNIGERHVLPLYPFALLLAAAAAEYVQKRHWGVAVVLSGLLFNAADVSRYAPGYLSYMNIFVKPESSYRLLSDSNTDWGQGLLALRRYQDQHPGEQISLAYFGSVDPEVYGINARLLGENERTTGTVVVGATQLSGQYPKDRNAYQWPLGYKVRQILDHCMYVFEVDR